MSRYALRILLAATVLLGASTAWAKVWTTHGGKVKFETRSTAWKGGKKVEWERRITGKSGVTKINGMSWGRKVKGTAETLKDGSTLERLTYTSQTGEVRKVTIKAGNDGKTVKTIDFADKSSKVITSWVSAKTLHTVVVDLDPKGNVLSTRTDSRDAPQ